MAYVSKAKPARGGFAQRTDQSTSYRPMTPMPTESPRVSMIRICDNRLRMIRYWNVRRHWAHVAFLCEDLNKQIRYWMSESRAGDHQWYSELLDLVKVVDLADPQTLRNVYGHINKPYPTLI